MTPTEEDGQRARRQSEKNEEAEEESNCRPLAFRRLVPGLRHGDESQRVQVSPRTSLRAGGT
jgi:hypothetical protein